MTAQTPLIFGQYYHIYSRGNNHQPIFFEQSNYRYFLKQYAKYIQPIADTYVYCLLKNHFHFLVLIKTEEQQKEFYEANLLQYNQPTKNTKNWHPLNPSRQFSNFFNSYAKSINKSYNRVGSLFQKNFGRKLITTDSYFTQLITYIHHNPQYHGFITDFQTYPHSSYQTLLSNKKTQLKKEQVLAWFDGLQGFIQHHKSQIKPNDITHLIGNDDF